MSVDGGSPREITVPHVAFELIVTHDPGTPLAISWGVSNPNSGGVADFPLPDGSTAQFRLSETQASGGHLTLDDLGGGRFEVTGFFDIFFEISTDLGATWIPASGGAAGLAFVDVVEPTTATLLGLGAIVLGRRLRPRMS